MNHIKIRVYTINSETHEEREISVRTLEGEKPNPFLFGRNRWPKCECPLHR